MITVAKDENGLASEKCAEGDSKTVELDHDEPGMINAILNGDDEKTNSAVCDRCRSISYKWIGLLVSGWGEI